MALCQPILATSHFLNILIYNLRSNNNNTLARPAVKCKHLVQCNLVIILKVLMQIDYFLFVFKTKAKQSLVIGFFLVLTYMKLISFK